MGICGICATNLRKDYSILWRANRVPNHPSYAQLTNVDAIALTITLTANPNDNPNPNPNPNDNHNPNLSENKNSRFWISRGGYWFVSDGCHAGCYAQGGQNSRQNGDYRLNDVFPSFFFHGL